MAALNVRIEGFEEMAKKLRAAAANYKKKVRGGLNLWAERVMTVSKDEFVPVKEGVLRSSGRVDLDDDEERMRVFLSYGGAADDYAILQHEKEDFHHQIGESKFLEKPLMQAATTCAADVAASAQLSEEDLK
jgi:hypothetical protein